MERQDRFTNLIKHSFGGQREEILMCLENDEGYKFDSAKFGERVAFITEDTKGVASNGGCAFDCKDGTEAKALFLGQTYMCPVCSSKNNYYSSKCTRCGSTERIDPNDTRWGIDCEAHVKYYGQIPNYVFSHIQPLNRDLDELKFRLRVFRVSASEPYFTSCLEYQHKHGSKPHKNFMPFGRDFYMSSPSRLIDCTITVYQSNVNVEYVYYNLDNKLKCLNIPISKFTKKELKQLTVKNGKVSVNEAVNVLGVKKSTHGKLRGQLNRNKNHVQL